MKHLGSYVATAIGIIALVSGIADPAPILDGDRWTCDGVREFGLSIFEKEALEGSAFHMATASH